MLRIAALSDIHGNVWALEAVLEDARRQGVDLIVDTGDLLSGPLEPAATADLLIPLGLPTIAGNHERQLLACEHHAGGPADQHAFEHTTPRHREWLRHLPPTLDLARGGVFLCHGSPTSDTQHLLEDVEHGGLRLAAPGTLETRAFGVDRSLILCGHSHLPHAIGLSGARLAVNPGSVGLQAYEDDHPVHHKVENGSPHARYAICHRTPRGWSVAFRCVAYDHHRAAETARANGREDWARWLETGRA